MYILSIWVSKVNQDLFSPVVPSLALQQWGEKEEEGEGRGGQGKWKGGGRGEGGKRERRRGGGSFRREGKEGGRRERRRGGFRGEGQRDRSCLTV